MSADCDFLGHADRPVTLDLTCDRPVAVKTYPAGRGEQVFTAMRALWASPFGASAAGPRMPEPLGFDEVTGALRMSFVEGVPLGTRGDAGATPTVLDELAELLASLHGSGVTCPRRRSADRVVRSLARKVPELDEPLREPFERVVAELGRRVPPRARLVIAHGDFSPRNVLVTRPSLVLIDFDRLQMASPARDVEYLGAWAWATACSNGARPDWELGDRFAAVYERLTGDALVDRSFHRAAGLLRIAHGWSALRARPDIARAVIAEAATAAVGEVGR